jgi:hypothetical protein
MPMVVMKEGVKESSLKRRRQHDFPTPESPISSSLICVSCQCLWRLIECDWDVPGNHNCASQPSWIRSRTHGEKEDVSEMGLRAYADVMCFRGVLVKGPSGG